MTGISRPVRIAPRRQHGRHIVTVDTQLVARVIAEKLRLSIYANCERAPFGWERGL